MISDKEIRMMLARVDHERGLVWQHAELSDSAPDLARELLAARKVVRAARNTGSVYDLERIDKALAYYDKATKEEVG